MERKEFTFIRETRTFPNFNFDEPTIIYSLENTSDLNVKVELLHLKCKVTINEELYFCAPEEKKWFSSGSIIYNKEKIEIGFVFCWDFPKTIKLDSEDESWIYSYMNGREIVKQGKRISFEIIRNKFKFKNIFKDNISNKVIVNLDEDIENEFLLIGLLFYLFEVKREFANIG